MRLFFFVFLFWAAMYTSCMLCDFLPLNIFVLIHQKIKKYHSSPGKVKTSFFNLLEVVWGKMQGGKGAAEFYTFMGVQKFLSKICHSTLPFTFYALIQSKGSLQQTTKNKVHNVWWKIYTGGVTLFPIKLVVNLAS